MTDEHNIYFTWCGRNNNIPDSLSISKIIPSFMQKISCENVYASSYAQYEKFCQDSVQGSNPDCFCAIFIYAINNIVVGFLNVRVAFSEAEIDFICVQTEYRRQYIAEKLFLFFEEFVCKQEIMSTIFLEVGLYNISAINFYEKLGFKKISIRKKYYKNQEDAQVMKKLLIR